MSTTTTRRDVVKIAAGLALGAPLVGRSAPVEAAARPDMAAVFAWEDALHAADARGDAWVKGARHLRDILQLAIWQTEEAGAPALAAPLHELMAEAEALHADRKAAFDAWVDEAWMLPDLAPLPLEPWL